MEVQCLVCHAHFEREGECEGLSHGLCPGETFLVYHGYPLSKCQFLYDSWSDYAMELQITLAEFIHGMTHEPTD